MKGIGVAHMGLLFANDKVTGNETYLVVVDVDLASVSYVARRKNCRGITSSLDDALRRAVSLARDESNSAVGVVTLSGEVVATAYAYDVVRGVYYTDPLVTGPSQNVAVWPHRSSDRYLYTSDNCRHIYKEGEGFPGNVIEHFSSELHTDKYFESLATVHA